jgi:hypothetical protein
VPKEEAQCPAPCDNTDFLVLVRSHAEQTSDLGDMEI